MSIDNGQQPCFYALNIRDKIMPVKGEDFPILVVLEPNQNHGVSYTYFDRDNRFYILPIEIKRIKELAANEFIDLNKDGYLLEIPSIKGQEFYQRNIRFKDLKNITDHIAKHHFTADRETDWFNPDLYYKLYKRIMAVNDDSNERFVFKDIDYDLRHDFNIERPRLSLEAEREPVSVKIDCSPENFFKTLLISEREILKLENYSTKSNINFTDCKISCEDPVTAGSIQYSSCVFNDNVKNLNTNFDIISPYSTYNLWSSADSINIKDKTIEDLNLNLKIKYPSELCLNHYPNFEFINSLPKSFNLEVESPKDVELYKISNLSIREGVNKHIERIQGLLNTFYNKKFDFIGLEIGFNYPKTDIEFDLIKTEKFRLSIYYNNDTNIYEENLSTRHVHIKQLIINAGWQNNVISFNFEQKLGINLIIDQLVLNTNNFELYTGADPTSEIEIKEIIKNSGAHTMTLSGETPLILKGREFKFMNTRKEITL